MRLSNFKNFNEAKDVAKEEGNLTGILNTKIDWYGEKEGPSTFYENFKKPVYSVRATFLNLLSYAKKVNITNVKDIIARWCLGKKTSEDLSKEETQKLTDYLNAIKTYTGLDASVNLEYKDGNFSNTSENILNLFKLVQGIITEEAGQLDSDDLGEYKSVPEIVIAAFELETNDKNSPPAYKKYGVDITSEEYKKAKEEFLKNEKPTSSAKKEGSEENKDSKAAKTDAFKKILKDFKK